MNTEESENNITSESEAEIEQITEPEQQDSSIENQEGSESLEAQSEQPTAENETDSEEQNDVNQGAPSWVKELRKANREIQRENRELRQKLEADKPAPKKVELGKKPTLEEADFDSELFEKNLENWYEQKRKYDDEQTKAKTAAERERQEWQGKLEAYNNAKAQLNDEYYEDAEFAVTSKLNETQQGIILQGASAPEKIVQIIGKDPEKLAELSNINDPVQFAFAIAKLETSAVNKAAKRKAPPPEPTVRGTSGGSVENQLDKLRAEAAKTGDYTKVHQYKQQLRNQKN